MIQCKFFKVVLPILFTFVGCISIWVSKLVFSGQVLYVTVVSHTILVILAFLGIILTELNLKEAGVISPNLRYSLYWGLYLSMSVCLPAMALAFLLHELGYASLRIEDLTIHVLLTTLITSLMLGGLCEELFFRGFVQSSLDSIVGYKVSPIASGVIFGIAHLVNYVNPLTGVNSLNANAMIWVLLSCFVGTFFGFLRRKSGDIYCSTLFHGLQDFTLSTMSILKYSMPVISLGVGWIIFLSTTYRQFIKSSPSKKKCIKEIIK